MATVFGPWAATLAEKSCTAFTISSRFRSVAWVTLKPAEFSIWAIDCASLVGVGELWRALIVRIADHKRDPRLAENSSRRQSGIAGLADRRYSESGVCAKAKQATAETRADEQRSETG